MIEAGALDIPAERGYAWKVRSDEIKERDGYVCQRCGESNEKYEHYPIRLQTHHIVNGRNLTVADARIGLNLTTVCYRCHARLEGEPAEKQFRATGRKKKAANTLLLLVEGRATPQYAAGQTGNGVIEMYGTLHNLERLRLVTRLAAGLYELNPKEVPKRDD